MKAFKHAIISVFNSGFLYAGFLALGLIAIPAQADHNSEHSVANRIGKTGSVCIEGQECKTPVAAVTFVSSGSRSGEDIYNAACSACHSTGAAGAPKLGDTAAWSARVNAGMAAILKNAINGINGMPARGLCMDCSDDELESAVQYMVDASQ